MATLKTKLNVRADDFRANAEVDARPGRRPARENRGGGARRQRRGAAAAPGPRQAAGARPHQCPRRSRRGDPRAVAARRLWHVWRRRAGGEHRHVHRPRRGPRMRDRRQRRDGEGRHLLSDDREEAPARAGNRAAESAAVHLPGGLRRRVPARAGRRVSRPRPFRPHLLQPGQHVGAGHRADRRGHGLVHGGRRVCAGDVGRDDHRQEPGDDLPGRTAAGEGRDRRRSDRGGTGRRRRAHANFGCGRPSGRKRCPCVASRAAGRGQSQHA